MKKTRTELRFFSVPEWKKEEEYLREQHKHGWEFVKVDGIGLYHFEECEPKDVVYQLDYNSDSINRKNEYVQMFNDCGWEYLQNYMGYSYFRKSASEMNGTEEEIFCDDASRLDMMKRVLNGRMIPVLVIFFSIIVPQMVLQGSNNTAFGYVVRTLYYVLFAVYLGVFISFTYSFWKYYKSINK